MTEDGRRLKFLNVVDEHTRECVALDVGRHFKAEDVIAVLARQLKARGAPENIRSDNGPEFIARAVRGWLEQEGIATAYIAPGAPWENALIETFNGKLRDELLNREVFETMAEARHLAAYLRDYNHHRPHSSLDYMSPAAYAALCASSGAASRRLRRHRAVTQQPVRLS